MFAKTPEPPYYAVIFTSFRNENEKMEYAEMAIQMVDLAKDQEGFLGMETARNEIGITISYWKDLESIKNWKNNSEHQLAQINGRKIWYDQYFVRIAKVERQYGFENS